MLSSLVSRCGACSVAACGLVALWAGSSWAAGPKSDGVPLTAARIDGGPRTTEQVTVPKGYTGKLEPIVQRASDRVRGTGVSIEQRGQQLTVTGPGGESFTVGSKAAIEELAAEWRSQVAAAKQDPAQQFLQLEWSLTASVRGAGTAGMLFSTLESRSTYAGGAHPSNSLTLATHDARTGKRVTLDELLTPRQLSAVVKVISAKLRTLGNTEGVDGSLWTWSSPEVLQRTISENFALTTAANGRVQLHVAWESGVHAIGGQLAHFTFDAPVDAAFRAKLGLE
ncbi:MAG: hypothetical protein JNJ54_13340 [Myxococcaceae bacterium]|nr:hypothetical protein [Myxococcaceae bacterium]